MRGNNNNKMGGEVRNKKPVENNVCCRRKGGGGRIFVVDLLLGFSVDLKLFELLFDSCRDEMRMADEYLRQKLPHGRLQLKRRDWVGRRITWSWSFDDKACPRLERSCSALRWSREFKTRAVLQRQNQKKVMFFERVWEEESVLERVWGDTLWRNWGPEPNRMKPGEVDVRRIEPEAVLGVRRRKEGDWAKLDATAFMMEKDNEWESFEGDEWTLESILKEINRILSFDGLRLILFFFLSTRIKPDTVVQWFATYPSIEWIKLMTMYSLQSREEHRWERQFVRKTEKQNCISFVNQTYEMYNSIYKQYDTKLIDNQNYQLDITGIQYSSSRWTDDVLKIHLGFLMFKLKRSSSSILFYNLQILM